MTYWIESSLERKYSKWKRERRKNDEKHRTDIKRDRGHSEEIEHLCHWIPESEEKENEAEEIFEEATLWLRSFQKRWEPSKPSEEAQAGF